MTIKNKYDLVVYGSTGFTGRLVCEYLAQRLPDGGNLRWAMAGRSQSKLEALRAEIGAEGVPLIIADTADPASIAAMVGSARIVLTTVGPYQSHGTPIIEACARSGTDYLDLCGEPIWMRHMIDTYENTAKATGARIVFSCGFDSIPSELGVWFLQRLAQEKFGKPLSRVRGRVVSFVGGPSGGSVATGMATMKAAEADPISAALLQDAFALTPGFRGPQQPTGLDSGVEADVGPVRPFSLGPTVAKNVHRSNFLMQHLYGTDFVYDEMMLGEMPAAPPIAPGSLPKPGEGPTPELLANGRFELLFIGSDAEGHSLRACVKGSHDPGYFTTSRMISETALCLLDDPELAPGFWTPGAAFRENLINRLTAHADMTFLAVTD